MNARESILQVRVSDAELRSIDQAASRMKLDRSGYVRHLIELDQFAKSRGARDGICSDPLHIAALTMAQSIVKAMNDYDAAMKQKGAASKQATGPALNAMRGEGRPDDLPIAGAAATAGSATDALAKLLGDHAAPGSKPSGGLDSLLDNTRKKK